jgi:hypothetical protein
VEEVQQAFDALGRIERRNLVTKGSLIRDMFEGGRASEALFLAMVSHTQPDGSTVQRAQVFDAKYKNGMVKVKPREAGAGPTVEFRTPEDRPEGWDRIGEAIRTSARLESVRLQYVHPGAITRGTPAAARFSDAALTLARHRQLQGDEAATTRALAEPGLTLDQLPQRLGRHGRTAEMGELGQLTNERPGIFVRVGSMPGELGNGPHYFTVIPRHGEILLYRPNGHQVSRYELGSFAGLPGVLFQ